MIKKSRSVRLGLLLPTLLLSQFLHADTLDPKAYSWSLVHLGEPLDLSKYDLVFSEEFDTNDITPDGGSGRWYAPVHANYGVAKFDAPGPANNTYAVSDGVLSITATKEADGWHGGNIETVNQAGKGFAQKLGYFEARLKLPNMPGAWPAFWLKSQEEHTNPAMVRPEIDVLEWYGGDPKGVHSTVHLWPPAASLIQPGGLTSHWYLSNYQGIAGLPGTWHTFGALISPTDVVIYVDRKEVARFPTLDEYKVALYPLVSLTLYQQDAAKATSPFQLQVDYVHIYAGRAPKSPTSVNIK